MQVRVREASGWALLKLNTINIYIYAGCYILERDMAANLDPTYQVPINGGHKYEGQKIGICVHH